MKYPPIFPICFASTQLKTLLGSAPMRLWPFGEAEEGATLPYAVWQVIYGNPENYLDCAPDLDHWTIQVDVYANDGISARTAASAIASAIETSAYVVRYNSDMREKDTGLYRNSFDVDWKVQR